MRSVNLGQIWKTQFGVAFLVGLTVGTGIGIGEGLWVLWSQGAFGRYNDLVPWALFIDASALIAVEFGLALISGVILSLARIQPLPRHLVSLQLAETLFAAVLGYGLWSAGTANPTLIATNPLGVLWPPALLGLVAGELLLAACILLVDHAPLLGRLRVRYWLLFEAAVVAIAIAFGFSR